MTTDRWPLTAVWLRAHRAENTGVTFAEVAAGRAYREKVMSYAGRVAAGRNTERLLRLSKELFRAVLNGVLRPRDTEPGWYA